MLLLLDAVLCGCVVGILSGGRLRNIMSVQLRAERVLIVLFAIQLVLPQLADVIGMSRPLALSVWVVVMVTLSLVALLNMSHFGMLLVSLGIVLNALVIALNGAMPVSEEAASTVVGHEFSMQVEDGDILHEPLRSSTVAPYLADVIALPGPTWHRGVISAGDLLIALGVGVFVLGATRKHGT